MLKSLSIKEFGIYKSAYIDFSNNMNVITGETGSGKSLIVNALAAIRGLRTDSSVVRAGANEAKINAIFEIDNNEISITRIISADGKTTSLINDEVVTLQKLHDNVAKWCDVIGQNSSKLIFDSNFLTQVIDDQIKNSDKKVVNEYKKMWIEYSNFLEINKQYQNKQKILQEKDFYEHQLKEISKIDLSNIEFLSNIDDQIALVIEQNENKELIERFHNSVENTENSLDETLAISSKSNFFNKFEDRLNIISTNISDILLEIATFSQEPLNDEEINHLMSQKYILDNLLIKYGPTLDDLIEHTNIVNQKISDINTILDLWDTKQEKIEEYIKNLNDIGEKISLKRKKIAFSIENSVKKSLAELMMKGADIKFNFDKINPNENGIDSISLFVETNPNEGLKPIEKATSGGELARILLAFWRNINEKNARDILICDEIDAGIGGETGIALGKSLKELSKNRQLICVTHLAQVAACAKNHIYISKHIKDKRAEAKVDKLSESKIVDELARMLAGSKTESALEHARELLVELKDVN